MAGRLSLVVAAVAWLVLGAPAAAPAQPRVDWNAVQRDVLTRYGLTEGEVGLRLCKEERGGASRRFSDNCNAKWVVDPRSGRSQREPSVDVQQMIVVVATEKVFQEEHAGLQAQAEFMRQRRGAGPVLSEIRSQGPARYFTVSFEPALRQQVAALYRNGSTRQWLSRTVVRALEANLLRNGAGGVANEAVHNLVYWDRVKEQLTQWLSGAAEFTTGWQAALRAPILDRHRSLVQAELDRADRGWERIPARSGAGAAVRARYQELVERRERAIARQLTLDLAKADVDYAFNVLGNGVRILATSHGNVAVLEGVSIFEKGLTTLKGGLDKHQGDVWLRDCGYAAAAVGHFAQAILED